MVLLQDLLPAAVSPLWSHLASAYGINDLGQIVGLCDRGVYNRAFIMSPVYPSFDLYEAMPGVAGEVNQISVSNVTPGTRVYFCWSAQSGGRLIPGCDATVNALQLESPEIAGSAVADGNGVATLKGKVPRKYAGDTLLFQAVVPGECTISNLVVQKFE
ncbi:MAG: hypothetical protein D8M59_16660 [Planctomycetes bacterium]|nr:hypothetical protein [Planctomycetota bacterium]